MKIICFHNPDEENGYLSNWYLSEFIVSGIKYSSIEQYMMHQKALWFQDVENAAKILATDNAADIKQLGRMVAGYDDNVWNGIRQIVVYQGLLEKFAQNEDLKEKLAATENSILAECAVNDCIWGIGLSMKDPERMDKRKWKGQNLLGYAIMMVRENIKLSFKTENEGKPSTKV